MSTDHKEQTTHLGRDMVRLVAGYPGWHSSEFGHHQLGLLLGRVIRAAVVAADPDARVVEHAAMERARKAAARALAEIVKATPALEPEGPPASEMLGNLSTTGEKP